MGDMARRLRISTLGVLTALALLAGLLGVGVAAGAPAPGARAESFAELGRTMSQDRVLRRGCSAYRYSYSIKPPTPDWGLEIFVVDPRGNRVWSDAFIGGDDDTRQMARFQVCSRVTVTGVFRIRGKLTYTDGFEKFSGFIKTSTFRLCKAPERPGPRPCSRAQQTP